MAITKTDIIKKLSQTELEVKVKNNTLTQDSASEVFNAILNIISEGIKDEKEVQITGFGTFKSRVVESHQGVNPKTGDPIIIPRKTQISFSSGSQLKKCVNNED
jgi:DNA-binding protein HU-beta